MLYHKLYTQNEGVDWNTKSIYNTVLFTVLCKIRKFNDQNLAV